MAYVNYLGDEIGLISHPVPPKPKKEEVAFHKGWHVQGVPAQALKDARAAHKRSGTGPWSEEAWLMAAKSKAVRAKPYSIRASADECAALARRSGWLRVEVVEIKKGEAPKRAGLMARGNK